MLGPCSVLVGLVEDARASIKMTRNLLLELDGDLALLSMGPWIDLVMSRGRHKLVLRDRH